MCTVAYIDPPRFLRFFFASGFVVLVAGVVLSQPVSVAEGRDPRAIMASIEAREVPRVHTPLSVEQLGELLITAHRTLYGTNPSPERLLTAWAQVSLETARGKQCYGNNLGNIVVNVEWPGANYTFRVHERIKRDPDVWKEMLQRFRAYDTPLEGAMDYWRVITMNFGRHLPRFDGGEPREAGTGLCNSGYSTSDCATYGQSMAGLYTTLFAMFHHRLRELRGKAPAAMTWPLWEELERRTGIPYCGVASFNRLEAVRHFRHSGERGAVEIRARMPARADPQVLPVSARSLSSIATPSFVSPRRGGNNTKPFRVG